MKNNYRVVEEVLTSQGKQLVPIPPSRRVMMTTNSDNVKGRFIELGTKYNKEVIGGNPNNLSNSDGLVIPLEFIPWKETSVTKIKYHLHMMHTK